MTRFIVPENAAGLGDFHKDADVFDQAGVCHFVYHSATFQGNTAPSSIIESLSSGLRQWANDFECCKAKNDSNQLNSIFE